MITRYEFAQIKLFEGLTDQELDRLYALAHLVSYPRGSTLFIEEGQATRLFVLIDGTVDISSKQDYPAGSLHITTWERFGDLIGWSGLVPPDRYTATAVCREDSSLMVMDVDELLEVLEADPEMAWKIMRRVGEAISNRLQEIQGFVLKTL